MKLAEYWNADLKVYLIHVFEMIPVDSKAFIDRIQVVLESNDPIARSMTYHLLGIQRAHSMELQYRLLLLLKLNVRGKELEAGIFCMTRICIKNPKFAIKIARVMFHQSKSFSIDHLKNLFSIFEELDGNSLSEGYVILKHLISISTDPETLLSMIWSCTKMIYNTVILISQHIDYLISLLKVTEPSVMFGVLENLIQLASLHALKFTSSQIEILCVLYNNCSAPFKARIAQLFTFVFAKSSVLGYLAIESTEIQSFIDGFVNQVTIMVQQHTKYSYSHIKLVSILFQHIEHPVDGAILWIREVGTMILQCESHPKWYFRIFCALLELIDCSAISYQRTLTAYFSNPKIAPMLFQELQQSKESKTDLFVLVAGHIEFETKRQVHMI
jgi:hypothetical protein